jgi:hypothetical protein
MALAMGLELNLDFSRRAPANFHDQAQQIFEAIMGDQMNWRLLHAFFTTTDYAKRPPPPAGVSQHATLPPQNRRFDLRVQTFSEILNNERAQPSTQKRMLDLIYTSPLTELNLAAGQAHTADFHSDKWEDEFRDHRVRPVAV